MGTDNVLNCDAIDMTPRAIDWADEHKFHGGEGWLAYEAKECETCGRTVVMPDVGECECREILADIEEEIDGEMCEVPNTCRATIYAEGPMMNYWYPVKIADTTEAARAIAHLPLCVVEFPDGETGLALTGGGMDLSWEICEAFTLIGYHPPLHFAELPAMAGRGKSDRDLQIIAACEESCRIAEGWARGKRERLARLRSGH